MTPPHDSDPLKDYSVIVPVVVQWGDQDAFGHVNNTIFLRWFEVGRIAYFSEIRMMHDAQGAGRGPILAAVACNFRRQVTFPDEVRIGSRLGRIGTSSLVLEHLVVSVGGGAGGLTARRPPSITTTPRTGRSRSPTSCAGRSRPWKPPSEGAPERCST